MLFSNLFTALNKISVSEITFYLFIFLPFKILQVFPYLIWKAGGYQTISDPGIPETNINKKGCK